MTAPLMAVPAADAETRPLVEVRDLVVEFRGRDGARGSMLRAVAGVSLEIRRGEVYGLVGESGSGKTTLARCLLRLVEPTAGSLTFDGQDVTTLRGASLRELRRRMQVVYQDPAGSLDPRMSVLDLVAEPLRTHAPATNAQLRARVIELLDEVGLGRQHLDRRPHELSGGQAQRVAIARALALRPDLVVLDEPTSALDVSVQAQILNLLGELRRSHALTYLLISHDLSVVHHLSDRIGVMYLGRLAEQASTLDLFAHPEHPYTAALLRSAPDLASGDDRSPLVLSGDIPSPTRPPAGCRFHPRCWLRDRLGEPESCATSDPQLRVLHGESSHQVACHFAEQTSAPQEGAPR